MKFGLEDAVVEKIQKVFEDNPKVDEVLIFGSRAKGNHRENSDIDLALKGRKLSYEDIVSTGAKLDELNLPYEIDLLDYKAIGEPALAEHIDRVGVVFWERWKEYRLEEVVEKFIDYRGKTPKKTTFGIPLITAKIIKDGKVQAPNEFIAEEDYLNWMTRGFPEVNDIILTTEAPLGEIALLKDTKVALAQRIITLQTDKSKCNSIFLKYYLESSEGQGILHSRASGSTVEGIKSAELKKIIVRIPNLIIQNQIASTLSSLDDKIDLLQRQNKTLEELAEASFEKVFINDLDESWAKATLFDSIKLIGGGTPKTSVSEYWDGTISWLSGGDIASNHKSFIMSSEKSITEAGLQNSSAKLLPKYATVISARGTVGKYCLLAKPMTFSQSNYGVLPKYNDCFFFTYLLIATVVEQLQSSAYGSVFDTITTSTFMEHSILLPSAEVILEFEEEIKPYFYKMESNQNQIVSLKNLRDSLLPKLMSGETRINTL